MRVLLLLLIIFALSTGMKGLEDPAETDITPTMSSPTDGRTTKPPDDPSSAITLVLCPGVTENLILRFPPTSHPLDIYLLLDFTGTMQDKKQILVQLIYNLFNAMMVMGGDHLVGFGSFVDKNIQPSGWPGDYSFKNDLPLTTPSPEFVKLVESKNIMSGFDFPDSQLDAIYQAAWCTKEIGWRKNSRRVLVLVSDDLFHNAGDADTPIKLKDLPDSMKCNLNSSGYYANDFEYDYPTLLQIVDALNANQINPIFALDKKVQWQYKELTMQLPNSTVVDLVPDTSDVVKVILETYHGVANGIELKYQVYDSSYDIKFFSTCGGTEEKETLICKDIGDGKHVDFRLEISGDCSKNDDTIEEIVITAVGIPTKTALRIEKYCTYCPQNCTSADEPPSTSGEPDDDRKTTPAFTGPSTPTTVTTTTEEIELSWNCPKDFCCRKQCPKGSTCPSNLEWEEDSNPPICEGVPPGEENELENCISTSKACDKCIPQLVCDAEKFCEMEAVVCQGPKNENSCKENFEGNEEECKEGHIKDWG